VPFLFDDFPTVVDNPSIRDLGNLKWIFIGSRRFLTNFSYAADQAVWGARPFGFHLTNLVLHALVVVALYELGRRLWQNDAPALSAAALFAVHPLGTESVAYVSSRAGILCALFLVTGTWAYHRALTGRRWWLIPALICWPLAAASRETGLLLPVLWVACDVLYTGGWRRRLPAYVVCGLAGGALAALRIASYLSLERAGGRGSGLRLLTQAGVFWRYVFLWIVPVGQSLVHEVTPVTRLFDVQAWVSVAGLAVAIALLWSCRRRAPDVTFAGLWFVVLLLPAGVMPLAQSMAEHRVYEAAPGLALLSALALRRLPRPALICALIVAALGVGTVARVHLWRQPVRLWRDAAEKAPHEWLPHYAYGDALREAGDCARAIDEYTAALRYAPADVHARRNRAICQATLGRFDEAEAEMRAELIASPRDAALHYNLGVLEARRNRPAEARAEWLRALELDPGRLRPCDDLRRLDPDAVPPVCARQMH
jgi:protein O-mannosyl-transferase